MVAPHVEAADRVVEREREIKKRAAGRGAAVGRRGKGAGPRPQGADRGIFHDGPAVIENEGSLQGIRVDEDDGERE